MLDLQKFSTSALLPRTTHKQESCGLIKHIGTETHLLNCYILLRNTFLLNSSHINIYNNFVWFFMNISIEEKGLTV